MVNALVNCDGRPQLGGPVAVVYARRAGQHPVGFGSDGQIGQEDENAERQRTWNSASLLQRVSKMGRKQTFASVNGGELGLDSSVRKSREWPSMAYAPVFRLAPVASTNCRKLQGGAVHIERPVRLVVKTVGEDSYLTLAHLIDRPDRTTFPHAPAPFSKIETELQLRPRNSFADKV